MSEMEKKKASESKVAQSIPGHAGDVTRAYLDATEKKPTDSDAVKTTKDVSRVGVAAGLVTTAAAVTLGFIAGSL